MALFVFVFFYSILVHTRIDTISIDSVNCLLLHLLGLHDSLHLGALLLTATVGSELPREYRVKKRIGFVGSNRRIFTSIFFNETQREKKAWCLMLREESLLTLFLQNLRARLSKPWARSSMVRRSYGVKPATSRMTSRANLTLTPSFYRERQG